jgi:hypothetical protein
VGRLATLLYLTTAMFALRSSSALLSKAFKPQPKSFMSTLSGKSKAYMDAAANGKDVLSSIFIRMQYSSQPHKKIRSVHINTSAAY